MVVSAGDLHAVPPHAVPPRGVLTRGVLTIMGSGETAPTMRAVHADLLARVAGVSGPAVLVDTPYGFQENADDLTARALAYFATSVGEPLEAARWRTPEDDQIAVARALASIGDARYVFAGPGSPTYALRLWRGTGLADALVAVLARGGGVTFASAAAVTLGISSVPVYEIYKAGERPRWRDGLGLLHRVLGLSVAVVPHYDNSEGGGHDTRFCYLGERRLALMERELAEDAFVLGVDEHTALVLDLAGATARVRGRGGVTVRTRVGSTVFGAGAELPIDALRAAVRGETPEHAPRPPMPPGADPGEDVEVPDASLATSTARLDATFRRALADRDVEAAVAALLELEQTITDWSGDSLQSDEGDRARDMLRAMVVRLGAVAAEGVTDLRAVLGPFVEAVLTARAEARARGDYATADVLRDRLEGGGVEVRDTPDGAAWELR